MALNYEGTDQYIPKFDYEYVSDAAGNNLGAVSDGRYDNLVTHGASAPLGAFTKQGWYVDDITTDLQTGSLTDFIKKENKYFGYIRGSEGSGWKNSMWGATSSTFFPDKDLEEFSVQGIGIATAVTDENGDPYTQSSFTFTIR